ncbi:MAG: DNA/RNA-binding protein AlbA [Nanoarchaeota archaeon]|nr:DNA/RNA-binding protein AlbA [Nanoarchaeota archaeon]
MVEDGEILIGKKPFMNYITAVSLQFSKGLEEVFVKARGDNISKAVEVAMVAKTKFLSNVEVGKVSIASEPFKGRDGKNRVASSIAIQLIKK